MKSSRIILSSTLLLFSFLSFGQYETSNSSAIEIIPHWIENDEYSIIIKSTTTDLLKEKPIIFFTTFDAKFKVVEKNETEYLIDWIYTNSNIAANDPNYENTILGKLSKIKFEIRLSDSGKFIELVNVEEIRKASEKVIDELNAIELSPQMKVQYNGVKQMITTQKGLEIALLKYIKIYFLSFGYAYEKDFEQINNIKYPNPLGGEPFDAIEKVKLFNLDLKNSICKIETSKIIDGKTFTKYVMDFLKQNNKTRIKEIEQQFGNKIFDATENSIQEVNFKNGILKSSTFNRTMDIGLQNRSVLIEIETVN